MTLISAVLFIAGIQNTNGQIKTDNAKLEGEIGKVLRGMLDAFVRRDSDGVNNFYADDGFVYDSSGYSTSLQTKIDFRAYFQMPSADSKTSYEIEDLKVIPVSDDTAIANYTVITKTEQDGKTEIVRDRTTNVFARRGGRWLIIADHTSRLPTPLAPTVSGMPIGWRRTPSNGSGGYLMTVDTNIKHSGKASASVKYSCPDDSGFGSLAQSIAADDYQGKRVRLTGWLKTENADEAGLWMRVDGNRRLFGFDNMSNRAVKSTTDWKQFEVVLDVPTEAVNIVFGTIITGKGRVWADDFKLEIVGQNIRSTNQLSSEQMQMDNPNRTPKKSDNKQPVNLGFENGTIP